MRSLTQGPVSSTLIGELIKRLPARRLRAKAALKWRTLPGNVRGGLWILLATFFLSIMVALIKIAGQHMHVTEILFFRQLIMLLLAMPVLLMHPDASPFIPVAVMGELNEALPRSRLRVFAHARHGLPFSHAAECARELVAFIDEDEGVKS